MSNYPRMLVLAVGGPLDGQLVPPSPKDDPGDSGLLVEIQQDETW